MSLSFSGRRGSLEIRWIVYALLRDNVRHHLARGDQEEAFPALHCIGEALGGKPVKLSASALGREMEIIRRDLFSLPISQLALGAQTRAAIHLQWPSVHGTTSEVVGPLSILGTLVEGVATLGQVFAPTVSTLLELTVDAGTDDQLEVADI